MEILSVVERLVESSNFEEPQFNHTCLELNFTLTLPPILTGTGEMF